MPMGPAPEINTSSPVKSYVSAVCTALPNGSKKAAISDGIAVPIDDCPKVLKTQKNKGKSRPTSDLLKVLLKLKCEEHSVAQKLIASSDEIDELARNDGAKIRALNGWRRAIFGEDALALKHGKIAVTMKNDKYKIINI